MPSTRLCPRCGSEVSSSDLGSLCPVCLARNAFTPEPHTPSGAAGDGLGSPLTTSRYFGDYELIEEIARGGMGVIYKARQISLNRTVAVKMILAGQLASPADVQRFLAEAEAAANLQHPNIVAIHEVGQREGQHFFSMDYIEGKDLARLVNESSSDDIDFRRIARWLKTLAEAIHYAHQQGILHRDLKPSNVLVDAFDQPRITDFGLAKRVRSESDLTISGQVIGTPNFIPPEQAAARRGAIGPQSDVYSLGAILFFASTGRPPFVGHTAHETLNHVLRDDPLPPQSLNSKIPRNLATICLKCLEKDLARRYPSAQALADDLDRFLRDEPILARPISAAETAWRMCRRHSLVAGLTVTLVLLGVAIAALMFRHDGPPLLAGAEPLIVQMPTRSAEGVSGLIEGKFYVTTPTAGLADSWLSLLHVYDPKSGSWKQLASSALPHLGAAGGVIGRKLYLAGGRGNLEGPCATLEVYDPRLGTWTSKKSMHTPRAGCAGAVLDGKLYVLGGHDGTNILANVESYDPLTDAWTVEPVMPTPRSGAGAAVIGRTLFVVGGTTDGHKYAVSVDAWKPGGPWTTEVTSVPMPVPASGIFAAAAGDAIYVAGGSTPSGAVDVLQAFLPGRHWWATNEPMPEARYQGSGAQVLDGKLYLFGGWNNLPASRNLPEPDVFVFDLLRNRWRRSVPAGK